MGSPSQRTRALSTIGPLLVLAACGNAPTGPSPDGPPPSLRADPPETLPLAGGGGAIEFAGLGANAAVGAGGAVASWGQISSTGASARLYVSTRMASGWSMPEHIGEIALPAGTERGPLVAIDPSGVVRVAWLSGAFGGEHSTPHVATRRPRGDWETTLLSRDYARRLQLCVTGTSAFAAWYTSFGWGPEPGVFMAEDHGSGWGVQRITADGDHPALASSGDGRVLFAWEEMRRLRAAVRDPGGTWSARRELPQSAVGGSRFDLAVAWDTGGEPLVSWSDGRRAFLSRSAGDGWSLPEVRGDDGQTLVNVQIAAGAPSAPLRAWNRGERLIEAVRGAGAIESVASGTGLRHLLADRAGNALVCWVRWVGPLLEGRESWCSYAAAGRQWGEPARWGDTSAGPTVVLAATRLSDDSYLVLFREARQGGLPVLWSQRIRLWGG